MKKYIPLLVISGAISAWFLFLFYQDLTSLDYLKREARGAMSEFVVFDSPKETPQTRIFDRQGNTYSFADFKGKTLLINFWATWCEPCREEMPTLLHLQQVMEGEDFLLITVSIDWQGYKIIDPFLEEYQVTGLTAYWDKSNRLPNQMGVIGLPLTVLIDKDGNWVGRFDGPAEWNSVDAIHLMRAAARK